MLVSRGDGRRPALIDLIEEIPPTPQPNIGAATRIVNLQQQVLAAAPDQALHDAASHSTDAVLASTAGSTPSDAESSAAAGALRTLAAACWLVRRERRPSRSDRWMTGACCPAASS